MFKTPCIPIILIARLPIRFRRGSGKNITMQHFVTFKYTNFSLQKVEKKIIKKCLIYTHVKKNDDDYQQQQQKKTKKKEEGEIIIITMMIMIYYYLYVPPP